MIIDNFQFNYYPQIYKVVKINNTMITTQDDNGTMYTRNESCFKVFKSGKRPYRCHHHKQTSEVDKLKPTNRVFKHNVEKENYELKQ